MSNLIITTTDGVLETPAADVAGLVKNAVASGKPLLIHIHGGLVGEKDAIAKADWLSKNAYGQGNVFPIFLIWKTSIPDALKHLPEVLKKPLFEKMLFRLMKFLAGKVADAIPHAKAAMGGAAEPPEGQVEVELEKPKVGEVPYASLDGARNVSEMDETDEQRLSADPDSSVPDMGSASIHLAALNHGFEPREPVASAAEAALQSLRTRRQRVSRELLRQLLQGKFENPMLGIYGAHMVLQRDLPPFEKAQTLAEVLGNLEQLIPGSPDVAALQVMTSRLEQEDWSPPPQSCSWPPMIRAGYLEWRAADWDRPGAFIQAGSVADRIRTGLSSGGVWTKWSAKSKDTAEFPGATAVDVMHLVLEQIIHTSQSAGLDLVPAQRPDFKTAVQSVMMSLGGRFLESLAPTVVGGGASDMQPPSLDVGEAINSVLSTLPGLVRGAQIEEEKLNWTGLNKAQAQEVAKLLRSGAQS